MEGVGEGRKNDTLNYEWPEKIRGNSCHSFLKQFTLTLVLSLKYLAMNDVADTRPFVADSV